MPRRIWSTGRSDFPYLFGKTMKCERGFPHAMDRNATPIIARKGLQWVAYGKTERYDYKNRYNNYENPMFNNVSDNTIYNGEFPKWGRQRLLKTQLRKQIPPQYGTHHEAYGDVNDRSGKFDLFQYFRQVSNWDFLRNEYRWTGLWDGGLLSKTETNTEKQWNILPALLQDLLVKENTDAYDEPFIHIGVGCRALSYNDEEDIFKRHGWNKEGTISPWLYNKSFITDFNKTNNGSAIGNSIHQHLQMFRQGDRDHKYEYQVSSIAPMVSLGLDKNYPKNIMQDGITRGNIYERIQFSYQDQVQLSLLFTSSDYLIPATKMAPWKTPVLKVLTGRNFKVGSNRFTPDSHYIGDVIDHKNLFRWENRSRRWWYIPSHYNFDPKTRYYGETDPQTIFKDFESVRGVIGGWSSRNKC